MADAYLAPVDGADEALEAPQGLKVVELLTAVRRRWWFVSIVVAAVLIGGYTYVMRQPRLYRAAATVRLQVSQAPLQGMQASVQRIDYRIDPLLSEQALIKSQQVAERVVADAGLRLSIKSPGSLLRSQLFQGSVPFVAPNAPAGEIDLAFGPDGYSARERGRTFGPVAYGDTLRTLGVVLLIPERPRIEGNVV